jgi:predicted Zn-dependent protease
MAEYRTGLAGVGALVASAGTPAGVPLRVQVTGVDLPGQGQLDDLARVVDRWTGLSAFEECDSGPVRALLLPDAVRTVLGPVLLALAGERWCERTAAEPFALDRRLTLCDDPLVPGRPGSRPICDDGVATRSIELVRHRRPLGGILDLATAARYGRPATGHGVRPVLGAPRPGYSNLRVEPGDADVPTLMRTLGTGVLVLDLPWGPAPNRTHGSFQARCPWVFAVRNGEVVGRVEGAVLSGNSFDLLRNNVLAIGADAEWRGGWRLPALVADGLRMQLP